MGSDGALAMQARVRLSVAAPAGALNFAIRPYPSQLVETLPGHGRMLARTSRDEFALFLPGETQAQAATGWALRLCASLDEPLLLEGERFRVEVAAGVASCDPDEIIGADDLIAEASSAMRSAAVGSVSVFDPEMRQGAHRRLQIEQSLRQAIDQQAFESWLQPVIDLVSCRVVEIEALLRWRDPLHGIVPPAAFLTEAIESGLIVPIGRLAMAGLLQIQTSCSLL